MSTFAEFSSYAGYAVLLAVAIGLVVVGVVTRDVLALRVRAGRVENVPCDRLPDYVGPLCAAAEDRLLALGFEPFACERQEESLASPHAVRWAKVYIHLDEKAYATLAVASMPDASNRCELELVSFYSDGHAVNTMDGKAHTLISGMPGLTLQDGYFGDIDAQWGLHRKGTAEYRDARRVLVEASAYASRGNRLLEGYLAMLLRSGWLRPAEQPGTYRFGLPRAVRFALRMLTQGRGRSARKGQVPEQPPSDTESEALARAQAAAYQRQADVVRRRPGSWLGKATLFVVSAVLFVLAFGITFSIETVLIILGVLLVHELGHVLAMRMFGYRDLQILFIPFLGAAAVGAPRQPKVYQQLVVALMGPVPGIILGYALMHSAGADPGGLWWQVGLIMLVLNYINLLPVMPLDGGQVMNLLVFSRNRGLRGLFTLLSAGVLGYGGWVWSEPVLLALAVLMLIASGGQKRQASLLRELAAMGPAGSQGHDSEASELERVFRALPRIGLGNRPFASQYQFVRGALDQLRQVHAGWSLTVVALALYGMLLAVPPWMALTELPVLGAVIATAASSGSEEAEVAAPDWESRLAQTTTAEARWEVLMEAGDWLADSEQYRGGGAYYAQAKELAEGFGADDPRLARTLVRISRLGEGPAAEDRARLERALAIQQRALGPDHLDLAETLEGLAMVYNAQDGGLSDTVAALRRALEIRRGAQGADHPQVAETHSTLAYVYEVHGRLSEAVAEHKAAAKVYRAAFGPADPRTRQQEERLADLYLSHGEYAQAVVLLESALEQASDDTSMASRLARSSTETSLGWARLLQDDYGAARRLFEAALRDHGELTGLFASDPSRIPLLLDLVYVHAAQGHWEEAREAFEAFVHLAQDTLKVTPEGFAARLEQRGLASPLAGLDWRYRRQRSQAQGIRLMLER